MATATPLLEAPQIGVLTLFPGPLLDTGYRLKRAITVHIEQDEGGSFVVSEDATGVFHYSQELSRAVEGFLAALAEEFEMLSKHEGPLSPAMSSSLEQLSRLLDPPTK